MDGMKLEGSTRQCMANLDGFAQQGLLRILRSIELPILEAIYDENFLDVSYGYRPGAVPQDAVRDLTRKLQFGRLLASQIGITMKKFIRFIILLFLSFLPITDIFNPSAVMAGHYSSIRGFSLDYPDGWVAATKEETSEMAKEVKVVFEKIKNINNDRIAVVIFDPKNDDFIEGINIIVSPGKMPLNDKLRREFTQMFSKQMEAMGLEVKKTNSKIDKIGGKKCLSLRWTMASQAIGFDIIQWQVAFPGKNSTYILTASATSASFPIYEEKFRKTFASFNTDGGIFAFWHRMPKLAQDAIIGALIGLFFVSILRLFKKLHKGTYDQNTSSLSAQKINTIKGKISKRMSTEEISTTLKQLDKEKWTNEAFEAMKQILLERGEALPMDEKQSDSIPEAIEKQSTSTENSKKTEDEKQNIINTRSFKMTMMALGFYIAFKIIKMIMANN